MPILNPLALNAADLRHTITIEQMSATGNAWEDASPEWTAVCITRASIVEQGALSPKETFGENELSSYTTHLITIRFRSDVSIVAGMRVNHNTKLYRIQIVQDLQMRGRVLRLFCVDLQANAE